MEVQKQLTRKEQKKRNIKFHKDFKKDISFFMDILNWRSFSRMLTGNPRLIGKTEIFVKYFDLITAINEDSKQLKYLTKKNRIPPTQEHPSPMSIDKLKAYNNERRKEVAEVLPYIRTLLKWREVSEFLTGKRKMLSISLIPIRYTDSLVKLGNDCKLMIEIIEKNKKIHIK